VALPLTAVLALKATAFEVGLLAAASYTAWLVVGLPAGAIVRRLPQRGVQVTLDLARAAAVASVPVAWWLGVLAFWQLIVVALVVSFANVFFDVANFTFLPRVVPKERLYARNSLMSGTQAATQLGGPSLAGMLVQFLGAAPALLADAASYLASAALLRTLPEVRPENEAAETAPIRAQVREGWHFVTRHPVIGPCMWEATAVNFVCGGQLALFTVYLVRVLHASAGLVGILLAAEGAGSLAGAALSPWLVRAAGSARACLWSSAVMVIGALLIPAGDGWAAFVLFAAGNVVFAAGVVVLSTTTRTYRQIAAPPELLSRVMATVRFVSWGAIPLGSVIAGTMASWLGPRTALIVLAAATVLSPLTLILSPVRHMRDFPRV
jgi:MFS family permease